MLRFLDKLLLILGDEASKYFENVTENDNSFVNFKLCTFFVPTSVTNFAHGK